MKKFFELQLFDNIENSTPNKVVTGTAMNDSIRNTAAIVTIQAGAGNDTIYNSGNVVKIYGDTGNDEIISFADDATISSGDGNDSVYLSDDNGSETGFHKNNVSIFAGSGDDYIYVPESYSNVTISGGFGDDYIELHKHYSPFINIVQYTYGDGDDTIANFDSKDTLYITASKSFSTMKSGSDMYIIFDNGSITLKNVGAGVGSSNIVTVKGGNGGGGLPTGLTYNSDKTEITASTKFKGSAIDLTKYSKVKNLNASALTKKVKITGNALDNKIYGGSKNDTISGGSGNDTLISGAGNDILTGGNGADVFVHSKGKDIIKDYTEGEDVIKIQDANIKSWKISGNNVIFTTTNGQITVQNGKGKAITITETKTYSSNVAELLEDNNFATADNISELVAEKPVAEFENSTEKITQENLITFAE